MSFRPKRFFYFVFLLLLAYVLNGCEPAHYEIQGYIEGRFTYISSNFTGKLKSLFARRGMKVNPGDLLFTLEELPQSASLEAAEAELKVALDEKQQADERLQYTEKVRDRREILEQKKLIAPETVDTAEIDYLEAKDKLDSAVAKLESARAKLKESTWSLEQKSVKTSVAASVIDTFFNVDEIVPANKAVLSLLDPNNITFIFYVPEPILTEIQIGEEIKIKMDGQSETIPAKVNFISPNAEYTPPVLYSDLYRSKLVYRIEALPGLKDAWKLHPGQPVTILLKKRKG